MGYQMGIKNGILNIDFYFITVWGASAIIIGNNRRMWRYHWILIALFIDIYCRHLWKEIWRDKSGDILYFYMGVWISINM